MRVPLPALLLLLLTTGHGAEVAADLADLPPVPNPYGFDRRLALRVHLEEAFAQHDVAGLAWEELAARYRALAAPPPAAIPAPSPPPATGTASAEQAHRDNLRLQLARDHGEQTPADMPDSELRARLSALRAQRPQTAPGVRPPESRVRAPPAQAAPAAPACAESVPTPVDLARLNDATGVLMGTTLTGAGPAGDRLLGVCFSADLGTHLTLALQRVWAAMGANPAARSGLLLLGHGDGVMIGVGGEHPVELTHHLRRNRDAYHALLGVERIDCVIILSCSRRSDAQFTAFRDGLGYYPTWRVSAWERTAQTLGSGIAAAEVALARPAGEGLRAAVFHGEQGASLAEAGERVATRYLRAEVVDGALVVSETTRR